MSPEIVKSRDRVRPRGTPRRLLAIVALGGAIAGIPVPAAIAGPAAIRSGPVRAISSPAGPGSREPNLVALPDGRVVMSWLEPGADSALALRCASFDGKRWSRPSTIAESRSFFANWADFPSLCALGGERLAAHWLWKSGSGTYAYDVRVGQSEDGGRTWGPPVTPHRDGTATEHGFVSLVPQEEGVLAVWLDGRNSSGHVEGSHGPTPDMTLRAAVVTRDGTLRDEAELDPRVCDCCQTAAVATDRGVLVAYRDRSAGEIRDISLARLEAGRWSAPYPLHADNWHLEGCPVNGPALDARGAHVAVVWYSAASDTPRVQLAFSDDGGATFGAPVRVDDGDPIGRVHVALLEDGAALVTWLEAGKGKALVRARRVAPGAAADDAITVARTSAARASGFPRVVRGRDGVVFAWTEAGKPSRVRVASLALRSGASP